MRQIFLTLSVATLLFTAALTTRAQRKDSLSTQWISEEQFIPINGLNQWITVKGDRTKPVILFLHGGPGSVMSPYSDNLYKEWEKDFIIVCWDQRGAGRTFGQHAPDELTRSYLQANPLTVEQMASDGIQVSEYLIKHLGKQKIILFGTSWGSVLGVTMATKRPDLFYAYVGHSQLVTPDDDLLLYNSVYKLAQEKNDQASLKILDGLGTPPYDKARSVGKLFRVVKKYEAANSTPAPSSWFVEAPNYNNSKDSLYRELGDDYSFVNFVGDKELGVKSMRATINFLQNNIRFEIPVYMIQGEHDLLTPKAKTALYFKKLQAPEKEYFLLPTAAHGFNAEVLETQYKVFKRIKAY